MSVPIPENIHIGTRIQIKSDRATVRYVGPVDKTKGEWLGIEWDDPKRGKHDGVHHGHRYFNCRYPTSGSFVRYQPDKIFTGTTFFAALKDRYTVEDEITTIKGEEYDASQDRGELYFGGNKQIKVETYGFEKVFRALRQLNNLKVVGLAEEIIVSAGDLDEIADAKLIMEDVDLSRNLISQWETISDIVHRLPNLMMLRLNQLRLSTPPPTGLHFSNLQTLSLNQTLITWKDIEILAPQLPQLEDLQLGGNEITELGFVKGFDTLHTLNLEDNLISDWKEVEKLGSLPNLKILFLNDNRLSKIQSPTTNEMFAKLSYLRIENNLINDWSSFDALDLFPNLNRLRFRGNPIFEGMLIELQIIQVVGRIQKLAIVNGNELTNRERIDSERFYLKSCMKDGKTHEEIASIHPSYRYLCKIHGEPDLEDKAKESSTSLKDRLINIHLTQRNINADDLLSIQSKADLPETSNKVSKRFLPTMTIRNVKNMIQRLLKIPASKQQLILLQPIDMEDRDLIAMDINDNLRDLKFYSINDGDEIVVLEN